MFTLKTKENRKSDKNAASPVVPQGHFIELGTVPKRKTLKLCHCTPGCGAVWCPKKEMNFCNENENKETAM